MTELTFVGNNNNSLPIDLSLDNMSGLPSTGRSAGRRGTNSQASTQSISSFEGAMWIGASSKQMLKNYEEFHQLFIEKRMEFFYLSSSTLCSMFAE